MDNFNTSPPSPGGQTFASDDIGGVQHARAKIGWGADGSYGDASLANPIPVQVGTGIIIPVSLPTIPSNFNLAQYGGVDVGTANAIHVQPGTGALWSIGSVAPGVSATSLGKLWGAVPGGSGADVGVNFLTVRNDTAAALTATNGTYTPLQVNATGHLWTAAIQSGNWSSRTQDGAGNAIGSTAGVGSDSTDNIRGLVVHSRIDGYDTAGGSWKPIPLTDGADAVYVQQISPVAVSAILSTVTVSDGGGSLTVDNAGTFAVQAAQSGTWTVTANAGSGTFVVGDGGGSLTVDGNVNASVSSLPGSTIAGTTATMYDYDTSAGTDSILMVGIAVPSATGAVPGGTSSNPLRVDPTGTTTQPVSGTVAVSGGTVSVSGTVTVAGSGVFHVDDNAGSLTVDAPANAPVFVQLSDGTSPIATLPVSLASVPSHNVTNAGTFAVQAAQSGSWTVTANAGTGTFVVGDGGGSLTVDGTVAATQSGAWTVTANAGTGTFNTSDNHTTAGSYLAIRLTDGASFYNSQSQQYTEDAASTGGEALMLAGTIRRDTAASSAGTTGDYATLNTDANGLLWTRVSTIDGGTITTITNAVTIQDGGNSITVDNSGTFAVQAAQSGAWTVTANAGSGTFVVGDGGGSLTVDGAVTVTGTVSISGSVTPGTGATNLGKAEDAPHADGDVGVMALAVRNDAGGALAGTNGDYSPLGTDSSGRLWTHVGTIDGGTITTITNVVHVDDNAGSLTVDNAGTFAVQAAQSGVWAVTANAGSGTFVVGDGGGSLTVDNAGTFAVQASQSGAWAVTANAGTGTFTVGDGGSSLTVDNDGTFYTQPRQMIELPTNASYFAVSSNTFDAPTPLQNSAYFTINGTFTGTITFYGRGPGTSTVRPISGRRSSDGLWQSTFTSIPVATECFYIDCSDITYLAAAISLSTGSVSVSWNPTNQHGTVQVRGTIGHDGAIFSDHPPIMIGGYASASAPSAVSNDGDAVRTWCDLNGRVAVFDGGSTLSVDDGAGSLTVDGTVGITNATVTAKGTQGANGGLPVQQLKDSGRTKVTYYAVGAAAGTTGTEKAIDLTKSSGTSATSTGVSHTPANGKTFRITNIIFATRGHNTATAQVTTFSIRVNTGGAVITTTTPIILRARCATPATANSWDRFIAEIPDGLEIEGNGTLQFGVTANAVYTTNAPTWDVIINGFEY